MFSVNKLKTDILKKMDKELLILEISNLTNSFQNLEKYAFGYLAFIIGYFANTVNEKINYGIWSILLLFLLFLIFYIEMKAKNTREYEKELYDFAITKSQEKEKMNQKETSNNINISSSKCLKCERRLKTFLKY